MALRSAEDGKRVRVLTDFDVMTLRLMENYPLEEVGLELD